MKRQIRGLNAADQIPDGVFLVRVQRVMFRHQQQKPYHTVSLSVLQPVRFSNQILSGRLYCTPKALWKLNWFLRDFGYDIESLGRDEVDEKRLVGLTGVVKISHIVGQWKPRSGEGAPWSRFDDEAVLRKEYRTDFVFDDAQVSGMFATASKPITSCDRSCGHAGCSVAWLYSINRQVAISGEHRAGRAGSALHGQKACDGLLKLGVDFVGDDHDIGQHGSEVDGRQIALDGLEDADLQEAGLLQDQRRGVALAIAQFSKCHGRRREAVDGFDLADVAQP